MVHPHRATERRRRAVLIAVAVLVAAPVVGVAGGSGTSTPAASTGTVAPLATPPSAPSSVRQKLSERCEEAVAPLRALMEEHGSGRALPPNASGELNAGLGAATAACSADEWRRFHDLELLNWLQRS